MKWSGEYCFGEAWIAYRGMSAENHLHAHAAVQMVVGSGVRVTDDESYDRHGDGWIICCGVKHRIETEEKVVILLVDPDAQLAERLTSTSPRKDVIPVAAQLIETVRNTHGIERVVEALSGREERKPVTLNNRLHAALEYVRDANAIHGLEAICRAVGISPSRLRALSNEQLGAPFSKIVLWRKVSAACQLLARGATLSDAAVGAGFSDQAHLTRTMKNTIGLTPGQTRNIGTQ